MPCVCGFRPNRESLSESRSGIPCFYLPEGNGLETSAQPMKVSNTHIRWFYWDIRASINFGYNRWIWTLGYGFSDFDIYACRRHITLPSGTRFYVPSREFSHTVYISLSYQL